MSESEIDARPRPEDAEAGVCRSCGGAVWWVLTTAEKEMPLDVDPVADGNIEMTRIGRHWRAEVLPQAESLFDVGRPRWRTHFVSCPQAAQWRRRSVPRQRRQE